MSTLVVAVVLAGLGASALSGSPAEQRRRLDARSPLIPMPTRASRQRLWTAGASGLAAVALAWLLGGGAWLLIAVPLPVLGYWAAGRLEPAEQRERRTAAAEGLPITLDLLAACVEAGSPLRSAVHRVAALTPPGTTATLDRLEAAVHLGIDEPSAWEALAHDPLWGPVARDVVRSLATGTPSREILVEHAGEVRRAGHAARLSRARSVGVRSTLPLMTCFLPAFLLLGVVPIVASLIPRFW